MGAVVVVMTVVVGALEVVDGVSVWAAGTAVVVVMLDCAADSGAVVGEEVAQLVVTTASKTTNAASSLARDAFIAPTVVARSG